MQEKIIEFLGIVLWGIQLIFNDFYWFSYISMGFYEVYMVLDDFGIEDPTELGCFFEILDFPRTPK